MTKEFVASRLDLKGFAESAATLDGASALSAWPRLLAESQGRGADLPVSWRATGELRNPGHVQPDVWLHLQAQARLPLVCQRCLGDVEVDVAVERSFRFVADEAVAAAEDEEAEEDVLALSPAFDLPALVEDELLMAIPPVPRHDVCPEPVKLSVADEDFSEAGGERANPFAVLQALKRGKSE